MIERRETPAMTNTVRRAHSFRSFFSAGIRRAVAYFVTVRFVYTLDLDQIEFVPQRRDLDIEEMNLCDLDSMYSTNKDEILPRRYENLRQIIQSPNAGCYMIKNSTGDVCGYYGLLFGRGRYDRIFGKIKDVSLEENGILTRDYTFKKFRRQGMYTFSVHSRLQILRDRGCHTAAIRIARGNVAPNKVVQRFGFRRRLIEFHFHLFNTFTNSNHLLIPSSH